MTGPFLCWTGHQQRIGVEKVTTDLSRYDCIYSLVSSFKMLCVRLSAIPQPLVGLLGSHVAKIEHPMPAAVTPAVLTRVLTQGSLLEYSFSRPLTVAWLSITECTPSKGLTIYICIHLDRVKTSLYTWLHTIL